jgi:cell division protein FtsX
MFDSLADQIRQDDIKEGTTNTRKVIRMVTVVAIAVVLFGGLYFGVQMLEG